MKISYLDYMQNKPQSLIVLIKDLRRQLGKYFVNSDELKIKDKELFDYISYYMVNNLTKIHSLERAEIFFLMDEEWSSFDHSSFYM